MHKQTFAALEREMRGLLEQTRENLHARPQAFGIGDEPYDPATAEFREARFLGDPARLMLHLAVETCQQMLPAEQRELDSIERQSRALFEQALVKMRTDLDRITS